MNTSDSLKKSGRSTSLRKTCRGYSPLALRQSCRSWPRSGTMRNGKCFPHPRSELRIVGNGFSLLPTPHGRWVDPEHGILSALVGNMGKSYEPRFVSDWLGIRIDRTSRASVREAFGGCVLHRVDDGHSRGMDRPESVKLLPRELVPVWVRRLKALGNAITPHQAYAVASCILEAEGMSVFPIPQKKQNKKSLRCPVAEGFFITKRRANQWQKVFFMASKSLR